MLCSELMNSNPVSVLPNTTVQKAALLMRAVNIGFLPVCDASGKVLGTVTDRDIAIRNVADGNPPSASSDLKELWSRRRLAA
ncbi:CBS domain-containing protein [Sorangium sp. So ce381]|uniref:CBS domain-containing protein n=1 Tax=Sorangium sp. So ce381 TaxID=3133307 RepID=UPI003F5B5DBF